MNPPNGQLPPFDPGPRSGADRFTSDSADAAARRLFDALPVGVAIHGPRGELLFVNRAARELLGLTTGQGGGRTWIEAAAQVVREDGTTFPPSDHPGPVALATGRSARNVLMGFEAGGRGERVWVLMSAEPVLAADGEVREVVSTLCDVTAQRRREDRLRDSEVRYRQLVEKAHDIIYRLDAAGRFTYVNPAASRVTGHPAAELVGRRALALVRADHRGRVQRALVRQVRSRTPSTYDEFTVTARDGRHMRIGQHVQLLIDGGRVRGFQAVARDLSASGRTHERPAAEPAARDAGAARAKPWRVLVVDDNDVNLKVTVAMLENLGYDADSATNGMDAVDASTRRRYDVVLMDCQMPELDGFKATAFIREREGLGRHVPIIALTASLLPAERQKCLTAGMDDFLCKPVGLRQLDAALRRWIVPPEPEPSSGFVLPSGHPLRGLEMHGQGALVAEVFGTFLETTPTYVTEMRAAHARTDAAQIVSLAHSLKGAAVQVGAEDLADLCARLQAAGRGEDLSGVAALLVALEAAFEGLRRRLEPQRQRLAQASLP